MIFKYTLYTNKLYDGGYEYNQPLLDVVKDD